MDSPVSPAAMTLDRYGHLTPRESEPVADRFDSMMDAAV
jgi:hypothetical protein